MAKMRSHSQTLDAVKAFVDRWTGRGYEKGESQQFWTDLLHDVLDIETPSEIISFESQVKLASTSFIDGYIAPTKVLIEQKSIDKDLRKGIKQSDGSLLNPFQQAKRYAAELPVSKHPRWVVTCNFKSFLIYDMENPHGEPEEVLLENLEKDYYRLRFLVEDGKAHLKRELEVSIKAGELVGKLYDAFLKQYGGDVTPRDLHSLNVLCVRLVFCLYAEDAGLFSKDQFYYYMAQYKPSQMNVALRELFATLDTKDEDRSRFLPQNLKDFPYVNGSLFQQHPGEDIPQFDKAMSELLLKEASLGFDWSEISPTIFGAVFESTLNPETRRSGGMHYTSIENIHKVIDPLFMNELRAEFEKIKEEKHDHKRRQKLETFQNKLASLTFLDPACGSGNFLTETYISLRRLENEAISLRLKGQKLLGLEQLNPIKVNIHQFYGIEINDFAVTVAMTALWIAESQMMHETERIIKFDLDYLPLKSFTNIHLGNALRMDWASLLASPTPSVSLSADISPALSIREGEGEYHPQNGEDFFRTSDFKMWGKLKERSREHRHNSTEAEDMLWQAIRGNRLGYKFRRQHAIHVYIADFVCLDKKLIIEIDGGYHQNENQQYIDAQRTHDLNALGFTVIRFTNDEVLSELQNVVEKIKLNLAEDRSPSLMERGLGGEARTFDYIMGNPPFVGYSLQSKEQKDDILSIYVDENGKPYKTAGKIDYVSAWYFKAAQLMQNTNTQTAFVSTNSITQGEQVAAVWKPLYDRFGIHINFAHRTFRWDSEASLKAHVHCVIVGFSTGDAGVPPAKQYTIYDNERALNVDRINPYLVNADDIWIESRKEPLCEVPLMTTGNRPADGGHLIIEANDYDEFVNKEPQSKRYIKRLIGSEEFINNKIRYCLWLVGASPAELRKMPEVLKRIEACRQDRLSSPDKGRQKLADTPHLFRETQNPEQFMVVPKVSSENRRYVPMGFFDTNTISTDLNFIIPNVTLYHFGVLTSNVHMAWMRAVCGRLKSDYRYSKDIVYNNFPWPEVSGELEVGSGEYFDKEKEDGKELQRADRLAESNGSCKECVCLGEETTQGGNLCTQRSNATSGSVNSVEYSRRSGKSVQPGVQSVSFNSEGICSRIGDTTSTLRNDSVLKSGRNTANDESSGGNRTDDSFDKTTVMMKTSHFPLPTSHYARITRTAQAILDARALYPDSSLADLYDEVTMPPELRRAHQNNDRAVMEAYGFDWRNMTESECVAELFKLYSKLVDEEKATVAPARRKRSTRSRVAPSGGESGG